MTIVWTPIQMSCGAYDTKELEEFDWTSFGSSYYPDTYKIASAVGRDESSLLSQFWDNGS